jgi:hypothetical protein
MLTKGELEKFEESGAALEELGLEKLQNLGLVEKTEAKEAELKVPENVINFVKRALGGEPRELSAGSANEISASIAAMLREQRSSES